tara:strand:+ start:2241 stop:5702 length:3462 start_codon:yes stop_codon:yes gene_type:complete
MTDIAELTLKIKSTEARVARAELEALSNQAAKTERGAQKLGKQFERTNKSTNDLRNQFAGTVKSLGPLIGAFSAISALRDTVGVLRGFEQTMAQVRGIVIDTTGPLKQQEANFKKLGDAAKILGAQTKFSAQEAAEGQLFLARAGFELKQIVDALPATLNLAAAASIDLGRAADIASNTLSQFGLAASETAAVGDILVGVANRSNTSVDQLAEALKLAGPLAAALGLDLAQTAAAAGVLGDNAIQASSAGTNLRGVFAALLNPTGQVRDVLAEIAERAGTTVGAFDITSNAFADVIRVFADGAASAQEMEAIFGRLNVSGAIALQNSADKVGTLAVAVRELRGENERLAKLQSDTLDGAFRSLSSAVQALQIDIGENGLGGGVRSLVDEFAGAIRILAGAGTEADLANNSMQVLAAAIEGVAAALAVMTALKVVTFLSNVGVAAIQAAKGLVLMNTALKANPLIAAAGIITGIAVALISLANEADQASTAQDRLNASTERYASAIAAVARARAEAKAAERRGESEGQVRGIENQIAALKRLQSQIIEAKEADRNTFVGFDEIKAVAPELDLSKLESSMRTEVQQMFEAALKGQVITPNLDFEAAVDQAKYKEAFEKMLADLSKQGIKPGSLIDGKATAEQFAMVEKATAQLANGLAILGAPTEQALGLIDDEMKALEARIETVKAAAADADAGTPGAPRSAGGPAKTDSKAADKARAALADLQEEIELRKKLAGLSTEEASILRTVAEVKKLAAEAGLNPDESAAVANRIAASERLIASINKQAEAEAANSATQQTAKAGLTAYVQALEAQTAAVGQSSDAIEVHRAVEEGLALARAAGITDLDVVREKIVNEVLARQTLQAAIEEQTKAERELSNARQQASANRERDERFIADIELETELLKLNRNEQMQLSASRRLSADATDEQRASLENAINALDQQQKVRALADDMAQGFGDAFEGIIKGTTSVKDALGGLIASISDALLQALVIQPLIDSITSGLSGGAGGGGGFLGGLFGSASARGNGFTAEGEMMAFARGGLVGALGETVQAFAKGGLPGLNELPDSGGGPSHFQMSNGRVGLMREKGPEFIMPAVRMPDGSLGVRSANGPATNTINRYQTTQVSNNYNVKTDPDNFRLSPSQAQRRASRMTRKRT